MPKDLDVREGVRDSIPQQLHAAADATCTAARGLIAMIKRIDNTLMFIDRTLRVSQPPISHKLGVRFWIPSTGSPREPMLVTWQRTKSHRWRAKRVQRLLPRRVNRKGNAILCADNTFRLATAAAGLISLRKELVRRLWLLRNAAERACNRYGVIDQAEATAIAEHADVVKRLEGAGYVVDTRTKGLPDQFLD